MLNRGMLAGVYSVTVLFGLLTVFFPVVSIWGLLGTHLVYVYGLLLSVGGIGAFIAICLPNYKAELASLWFVTGGYLIYAIAMWGLMIERIGVVDGLAPPYGPALVATVLTFFLSAKILLLIKKNKSLVKAANHAGLG